MVGTPIANRGRAELEELIGLFVNTLALRVDLELDAGRTQFDLSLFVTPGADDGLLVRLEYARDLFDAATMQRLLGHGPPRAPSGAAGRTL